MKLHEEISVRWIVLYICVLASISGGRTIEQPLPAINSPEPSMRIDRSIENSEDSFRTAFESFLLIEKINSLKP